MTRANPEHALQVSVTRYLRAHLHPAVAWTAVGHEARRSLQAQQKLKASGVKAGQADLRFVIPPNGQSGEIELKLPAGPRGGVSHSEQSEAQELWQDTVTGAGGRYAVCRSLAEVQLVLTTWGLRLRAHPFEMFPEERP